MPSDGSSRMSSQGEPTSARASARICCSPPDSVPPLAVEQAGQPRQQADHALDRALLGLAGVRRPGEAQILLRGQAGQDAAALRHIADAEAAALMRGPLRDVDAVDHDAAAGRRQQTHDRLQQRGLAHAVVADDAERLALAQLERDAAQHRNMAIAGVQIGDRQEKVARGGVVVAGRLRLSLLRPHHRARLPR